MADARIFVDGSTLILENSFLRREISLAGDVFRTLSLKNLRTGKEWARGNDGYLALDLANAANDIKASKIEKHAPVVTFAGDEAFLGRFTSEPEITLSESHPHYEQSSLTAKIVLKGAKVSLARYYQIYPDSPVTVVWTTIGGAVDEVTPAAPKSDFRGRILRPEGTPATSPKADLHDGIFVRDRHLRIRNLAYTDCSDYFDNFVQEEERYSYLTMLPWLLSGNLLFAESLSDGEGVFMLKESPILLDQPDHPSGDFTYSFDESLLGQVGWGFGPVELRELGEVSSWRTITGVYDSTPDADTEAVKSYLKSRCVQIPERDWTVTCNQWGDRNAGENLSESFVRSEIDACARLGISAYMLDAGWETGAIAEMMREYPDGSSPFYDHGEFWSIDQEKFPNGLHGLFDYAESKGIDLLFWFNPDHTDENANFEKDAETILRLYREFGAKIYKIDGTWMLTRKAIQRNREFLERVIEESNGDVSFQLDITNGARWGFFSAHHLGVLFVENRYTHWKNYFPYKVHKNLWELSRYLMPQRLQFEFLNNSPERDQVYRETFAEDDPFTPGRYPIEYCFAITMFCNPLAWFEPSNLSEEQIARLAPVISKYKEVRDEIFAGDIYPIGEKPSGRSITGFQSHDSKTGAGFVCAYREVTDRTGASMPLRRMARGTDLSFEPVLGEGSVRMEDGVPYFDLPSERSFALFRYFQQGASE
jgi:hypothetical protein